METINTKEKYFFDELLFHYKLTVGHNTHLRLVCDNCFWQIIFPPRYLKCQSNKKIKGLRRGPEPLAFCTLVWSLKKRFVVGYRGLGSSFISNSTLPDVKVQWLLEKGLDPNANSRINWMIYFWEMLADSKYSKRSNDDKLTKDKRRTGTKCTRKEGDHMGWQQQGKRGTGETHETWGQEAKLSEMRERWVFQNIKPEAMRRWQQQS